MHLIQFSHANGFPASTYNYLFELMEDTEVQSIERMGHGDFPVNGDLNNLASELIHTLESAQRGPVIGLGHSSGAVATLLAANRRPELFSDLILIEPPFFSNWKRVLIRLASGLGFRDKLGPTPKALKRRDSFPDLDFAKDYFLQRRLFQRFHPRCFEDYLAHGLQPSDDGNLELAFSKDIEVEIFRSVPTKAPKGLKQLKGYLIYGETSDIFWKSDLAWWQRALPGFKLVSFPAGHLFPLEQPEATAKLLKTLVE